MLRNTLIILVLVGAAVGLIAIIPSHQKPEGLVVGIESSYPPYTFLDDNGRVVGFDIDVAQAIAEILGQPLMIKQMSFDALVMALRQGKIDLILSGLSITPERLQQIAMVPYYGEGVDQMELLFWQEAAPTLKSVTGPVAVLRGSVQHDWLAKQEGLTPKPLDTISEAIMDVRYGKSQAALVETHSALAAQKQLNGLETLTLRLAPEDQIRGMGIGIRSDEPELIASVEAAVAHLRISGELYAMEAVWFQEALHD